MILYLDASMLVPLVVEEASSKAVVRLLERQAAPPLVSDFGYAEVGSAVSRLVRMRRLTSDVGQVLLNRFDLWRDREAAVAPVMPQDINEAGDLSAASNSSF